MRTACNLELEASLLLKRPCLPFTAYYSNPVSQETQECTATLKMCEGPTAGPLIQPAERGFRMLVVALTLSCLAV